EREPPAPQAGRSRAGVGGEDGARRGLRARRPSRRRGRRRVRPRDALIDQLPLVLAFALAVGFLLLVVHLGVAALTWGEAGYVLLLALVSLAAILAVDAARKAAFRREVWRRLEEGLASVSAPLPRPASREQRARARLLETAQARAAAELAELRRGAEAHRTFVDMWVHQMKTPLSVIQLAAERRDETAWAGGGRGGAGRAPARRGGAQDVRGHVGAPDEDAPERDPARRRAARRDGLGRRRGGGRAARSGPRPDARHRQARPLRARLPAGRDGPRGAGALGAERAARRLHPRRGLPARGGARGGAGGHGPEVAARRAAPAPHQRRQVQPGRLDRRGGRRPRAGRRARDRDRQGARHPAGGPAARVRALLHRRQRPRLRRLDGDGPPRRRRGVPPHGPRARGRLAGRRGHDGDGAPARGRRPPRRPGAIAWVTAS